MSTKCQVLLYSPGDTSANETHKVNFSQQYYILGEMTQLINNIIKSGLHSILERDRNSHKSGKGSKL